jgi:hypothetical protein
MVACAGVKSMNWPNLTESNYREECLKYVEATPPDSRDEHGRGIVICAGGQRLLTNAYVNITVLRDLGCDLPIEVWYRNRWEMDDKARALFSHLGDITFVRGDDQPMEWRTLNGWELKPYAILNCRFSEVLLLDADNTVSVNPEFLFDDPHYQEHGALFWPDYWRTEASRGIWAMTGVEYRDEPEFESGQAVIDKSRCWPALCATKFMNDYSDLTYIHIHGDKDTFRFGWHMTDTPFNIIPHGIHSLESTMCQHDWDGRIVLFHRNMQKWEHEKGRNHPIHGFKHEGLCFEALEELRERWDGKISIDGGFPEEESRLVGKWFNYRRIDFDEREIEFAANNQIGEGAGGCEEVWYIEKVNGSLELVVGGRSQTTMRLKEGEGGVWHGRWLIHEKMPIELIPLS